MRSLSQPNPCCHYRSCSIALLAFFTADVFTCHSRKIKCVNHKINSWILISCIRFGIPLRQNAQKSKRLRWEKGYYSFSTCPLWFVVCNQRHKTNESKDENLKTCQSGIHADLTGALQKMNSCVFTDCTHDIQKYIKKKIEKRIKKNPLWAYLHENTANSRTRWP